MKFITTTICSFTSCLLFADSETHLLSIPHVPEWTPPAKVIRELPEAAVREVYEVEQAGRNVRIERSAAPAEEPKVENEVTPLKTFTQEQQEQLDEYVGTTIIHVSAIVYYEGEKAFSRIRLQADGERAEAWSSIDFMEVGGLSSYKARGIEYYALIGNGKEENISASEAGCPVDHEDLNKNKAHFVLDTPLAEDSSALEAMRGLHAICNKEKDTLKAARKVMLENQRKAKEWEEANPPEPEDVTIRIWKRDPNKTSK